MDERNQENKSFVLKMSKYFEDSGINPQNFNCKYINECRFEKEKQYAHGMQCHIGYQYGNEYENRPIPKLVIISLDCGNGGAKIIEERIKDVRKSCVERADVHMDGKVVHMDGKTVKIPGTNDCARLILGMEDCPMIADYYAMTNACKCCHMDNANHMRNTFYKKCSEYKLGEINILNPEIILAQSVSSMMYYGLEDKLLKIDGVSESIKKYLFIYQNEGHKSYLIKSFHPSCRGRHTRRMIEYYSRIFPHIVEYIKTHPIGI